MSRRRIGPRVVPALAVLLAACGTTRAIAPDVHCAVARRGDVARVLFRHEGPVAPDRPPRVEATGGYLAEVTVSPDLRAVAVLWTDPSGVLACRFPDGRRARWAAGPVPAGPEARWTFLEDGVTVRATLPHAVPMAGLLVLDVRVAPPRAVVALWGPGTTAFEGVHAVVALPRDDDGVLAAGEHEFVLELDDGSAAAFAVGVDPDGVLTAPAGYAEILGGEG